MALGPGEYILDLFAPGDRVAMVAIPRGDDGGPVVQKIHPAAVLAAQRTQAWLRHLNATRHDIFVGVNPIRPGARGRTKGSIGDVMRLFVDIDERGDEALARILGDAQEGLLAPPSHVIRSSPGRYQVLWSVPRGELDHAAAEAIARGLVARYGADPAAVDVSRVLRLPGYRNWKRGGTPCSLVASRSGLAAIERFPAGVEADGPGGAAGSVVAGAGRLRRGESLAGAGDRSASGQDWAEVRSRLRRGEDPGALRAELEARRADKARPREYADRTVRRAEESLAGERGHGAFRGGGSARERSER